MGILFLLRHAKAKWADPGMKDFDRELDARGIAEAEAMGQAMKERKLVPQHTICSNAVRAKQTLAAIDRSLGIAATTEFTDDLYVSDAQGYLELAAAVTGANSVMLIGHNPMLEDLAIGLAVRGDQEGINELQMGFRTAGLAIIDFEGPPSTFDEDTGTLVTYLTPADL